ncbi:spermatogenesis associated 2-like isoform 2-T2 [Polymixia lowei]
MIEMSILGQRSRELVNSYDLSLEQRIVGAGSNLACKDEELWKHVEGLLKEGDAQDTHSLGLDPLQVMEESLKATHAPLTATSGRVRARGGLKELTKAFEVLEQAALNLYLGPWREEYKVVKMYSGIFTHCIKPVLSTAQILKLFGLLGYQPCSGRHEQLRRQSSGVSSTSTANLLHLSCAFFLARCECRLLLSALGKHAGDVEWELSLVRERQRGRSLQVALDNTSKMLEVNKPLKEELSGMDGELDLYTAEMVINDGESPRSLSWVAHSTTSPPAVVTHSNGDTSPSSLSIPPPREPVCVSTLNYQVKTSLLGSSTTRNLSATSKQPYEESTKVGFDRADSQSRSPAAQDLGVCKKKVSSPSDNQYFCSCVHSDSLYLRHCLNCNTLHHSICALLQNCRISGHTVAEKMREEITETRAMSPQRVQSLREGGRSVSPAHVKGNADISSLDLCDPTSLTPQPIPYHDCCDTANPDPRFICVSCWVFHSGTCKGIEYCQNFHTLKRLGVCPCGKQCSRKPLVLCRYCGKEYCNLCWYRNPVTCACGQTFDQSSSV